MTSTTQVNYNQYNSHTCLLTYFLQIESQAKKVFSTAICLPKTGVAPTCFTTPHDVSSSQLLRRAQGETRTKTNYITTAAIDSLVSLGSRCNLWNIGSISSRGMSDLIPALAPSFHKYFWVPQTVVEFKARTEELKFISWLNIGRSSELIMGYGQWERESILCPSSAYMAVSGYWSAAQTVYCTHRVVCVTHT